MAFERLNFEKTWKNPSDFPTYEDSETQVRADLQYHPDAIRAFLNEKLVAALESGEGAALIGASSGTVQEALNLCADRLDRVDNDIRLIAAGTEPGAGRAAVSFYRTFEAGEWQNGALRVPRSEHGMTPRQQPCIYTLRMRVQSGALLPTWGTQASRVLWDTAGGDLVIESPEPFSGDILVLG